jgi:tetratricopeptide (TPR) repeat protein
MQNHRLLGYAGQNIERALDLFPSDDRILFYAGVLHEVWASPVNQNVALPKGGKATFGTKESELKLARQFLQKSIAVNPGFSEARLHLGRVLGLLGQPAQAAAELQRAAAEVNDPALSYYASLFLGQENWKMTRLAEAREHYENAAKLFPTAQSPLLALSQMERVRGNAKDALATLQRTLNLPHIDIWKDDPWWSYDLAHVRDADGLIKEMQQALGGLSR